jgi:hypothetical protein
LKQHPTYRKCSGKHFELKAPNLRLETGSGISLPRKEFTYLSPNLKPSSKKKAFK